MEDIKILTAEADNGTFTFEIVDQTARDEIKALKEAAAVEEVATAKGTFLTIKNAGKGLPLKEVVVYGTVDPIESLGLNVTGRNLLPQMSLPEGTTNGVTITENDDGTYHIVGDGSGSGWADISFSFAGNPGSFIFPAGTYTFQVGQSFNTLDAATLTWWRNMNSDNGYADVKKPAIFSSGKISLNAALTYDYTFVPQFEAGTTLSDFVPYCGTQVEIDLQGNTVAALEDGTCDELHIDKSGAVTLTKNTDAGQVIDLGYVQMPIVPEDVNCIWANSAKTPTVEVTYALPSADVPAVLYVEQPLTASQQEQARKNIGIDALGGSTDYSAYGLPVLHLTGDTTGMTKDNAVELAYEYDSLGGTCTVKWQGSSSVAYPKKNYTIKFDQEFEAVEGWGAEKKYCFKANYIDHSHARNLVSAKLWGQIVKSRDGVDERLTALVNGGAVDGFPCVIMLNGEFHGLHTWNIPKDGWMYGMEESTDGRQQAILCAGNSTSCTAFKALFTGSEFDVEFVSNEDDADWVKTSFNTLIQACIDSDGTDLDTTVAKYLDWDSAIDYYIFTCLLRGQDMTVKNYLMVTYDGVKWFFGGYDMDSTYGLYWNGKSFDAANSGTMPAYYAGLHRVMELIKTYKLDALKARYAELRAGIMSEDSVATAFANFAAGIPTPLLVDDVRKWPTIPSTSASNTAQIVSWYERRCKAVDAAIEAL